MPMNIGVLPARGIGLCVYETNAKRLGVSGVYTIALNLSLHSIGKVMTIIPRKLLLVENKPHQFVAMIETDGNQTKAMQLTFNEYREVVQAVLVKLVEIKERRG